jgi:hypothetical protein
VGWEVTVAAVSWVLLTDEQAPCEPEARVWEQACQEVPEIAVTHAHHRAVFEPESWEETYASQFPATHTYTLQVLEFKQW